MASNPEFESTATVATGDVPDNPCTQGKPECYLVIYNQSKKNNIGMLVRSAVAFGATELIIVGCPHLRMFGDQGTKHYLRMNTEFRTCTEVQHYLHEKGVSIVGVEIVASARPITEAPFHGPCAFVLGNEGSGMSDTAKEICDYFVYIPQYSMGIESLNVAMAGTVILYEFSKWANFMEAPKDLDTEKYPRQQIRYDFTKRSDKDRRKQQQRQEKQQDSESVEEIMANTDLFSEDD